MPPKSDKLSVIEEKRLDYLNHISPEDWEKTPASVKQLVEGMGEGMRKLEQQLAELGAVQQQLTEKINRRL